MLNVCSYKRGHDNLGQEFLSTFRVHPDKKAGRSLVREIEGPAKNLLLRRTKKRPAGHEDTIFLCWHFVLKSKRANLKLGRFSISFAEITDKKEPEIRIPQRQNSFPTFNIHYSQKIIKRLFHFFKRKFPHFFHFPSLILASEKKCSIMPVRSKMRSKVAVEMVVELKTQDGSRSGSRNDAHSSPSHVLTIPITKGTIICPRSCNNNRPFWVNRGTRLSALLSARQLHVLWKHDFCRWWKQWLAF